ncbi:hypothetical protein LJB42_002781 [Komagataella kurtzmanii]|nr:hypothetical protein LJB42_002781 [Komagataella kurtzmanii]
MPPVKSLDIFFNRTEKLLEANPTTTKISIKLGLNFNDHENPQSKHNVITVRVSDPVSGSNFKFKVTNKTDMLKIFSFLGPHGIELPISGQQSQIKSNDQTQIDNTEVPSTFHRGATSILANKAFEKKPLIIKDSSTAKKGGKGGKKKGKKF